MNDVSGQDPGHETHEGNFRALFDVAAFAAEQIGGRKARFMRLTSNGDDFRPDVDWMVAEPKTAASLIEAELDEKVPVIFCPAFDREKNFGLGTVLSEIPVPSHAVVGFVAPASFLDSAEGFTLRESLSETWCVRFVATADQLAAGIYPRFEAAVVVLSTQVGRGVVWYRVPSRGLAGQWQKELAHMLRVPRDTKESGFVVPPESVNPLSWAARWYDPAIAAQEEQLAYLGPWDRLSDAAEVLAGGIHKGANREHIRVGPAPGAVRLISGREVSLGGISEPSEEALWVDLDYPALEDSRLRAGDLLIRAFRSPDDALIFTEIGESDLPAIADRSSLWVLRTREGVSPTRRVLLKTYLSSPMAVELLRQTGIRLRRDSLCSLPVPSPDEALQSAFDELDAAATQFEVWRLNVEDVLREAFNFRDLAAARHAIIEGGRNARLRVRAGQLVGDFEHTIRTQFPYPVAIKYRTVTALSATSDVKSAYEAALDCAEVLITYMGSLALALAADTDSFSATAAAVADAFRRGGSSIGFGTWWSVLTSLDAKRISPNSVLREFVTFTRSSEVRNSFSDLSARRNDEAHRRKLDPESIPDGLATSLRGLLTLMKAAEFLVDLPLVHTIDIRADSRKGESVVEHRVLQGDHPIVPVAHLTSRKAFLEKESLYCLQDGQELHLLGPFLITSRCPICKNQSVFHLDRLSGGRVQLKSLEHGHVLESPDSHLVCELLGVSGKDRLP